MSTIDVPQQCPCGCSQCIYVECGYDWCPGCNEHQGSPVGDPCPVDEPVAR